MSNLPSSAEQAADSFDRLGPGVGYLTVVIGYLSTILTTTHLMLSTFLAFTFLQVCYSLLLWWMIRNAWQSSRFWRMLVAAGLLMGITELVGMMPLIGLQWDWLLFLVSIAIFFLLLPLRSALGAGTLLYILMATNLLVIDDWNWFRVYPTLLIQLPAFAFVALFSLTLHFRWVQGDRTERLLCQLEESNTALEHAHRQLQEYADEVEELTIVRERTRLAREIHDTLGHYLSILTIQLETISKLQGRDPARAASEIAEARRVATQAMQEVRNAVAALRPASIATLGLPQAITRLAHEFKGGMEQTKITLDLETPLPLLSQELQVAFYRAAQEAFTNVRKHSQASKVLVRLRYEDESLELLILDNGCGITPPENHSGFGLVGLRERFELLGGQVVYGQSEQGGFRISVRAPMRIPTWERKKDLLLREGQRKG